jgi:hypothetical protein
MSHSAQYFLNLRRPRRHILARCSIAVMFKLMQGCFLDKVAKAIDQKRHDPADFVGNAGNEAEKAVGKHLELGVHGFPD